MGEIRRMTLYQALHVVFAKRDKEGRVVPTGTPRSEENADQFRRRMCKLSGWTDAEIRLFEQEREAEEKFKRELLRRDVSGDAFDEQVRAWRRERQRGRPRTR